MQKRLSKGTMLIPSPRELDAVMRMGRLISAAQEDCRAGMQRITPYRRAVRENGSLMPNFPGGVSVHARLRRAEGITIAPAKGKQPHKVKNVEDHLI